MKSRILVSLLLVTAVLLGACQPAAAPRRATAPRPLVRLPPRPPVAAR